MAIYPTAKWIGPIPASNYKEVASQKIGIVHHVIVGSAQSAISEFQTPGMQLSAHFVVDYDGTIYQLVDTQFDAYAQEAGNYPPTAYIAVEYAGDPTTPMTTAQLLSGAALTAWASSEHWFPTIGVVPHGTPGVTSHCNPNGSPDPAWGNHTCPGPIRLAQIPEIVYIAYLVQHPTPAPVPAQKESHNMATSPITGGQLAVRPDGGVFAYGGAGFFGSLPSLRIAIDNIVGIAATKTGKGYWLVGSDGAVYSFGDAGYHGSGTGEPGWGIGTAANPVVAIVTDMSKQNGYVIFADSGAGAPAEYACNETTAYH